MKRWWRTYMKKHIEVPVLQMSAIVEDTTKAQTKV
jgi:hypothetical protein